MKFSIIIPCYNVEKWVRKCIESIQKQTYQNWEIILVNDGSTDNTLSILNEYATEDERIQIINQDNQWVPTARNRGISKAKGEYLLFLDSDDWYEEKNGLSEIAASLEEENNDMLVFRYISYIDNGTTCSVGEEAKCLACLEEMSGSIYTGEEYLKKVLSTKAIYCWYAWLYAFKRSFWINNEIRFNPERIKFEDMDIIYQIILKAGQIKVLNRVIYAYRIRNLSLCHTFSVDTEKYRLDVCKSCVEKVDILDISDDIKKMLKNNFSYAYFRVLTVAGYMNKKERRAVYRMLDDNRGLMNFTTRRRNVFLRRLIHIFGLPFVGKIIFLRARWQDKKY